LSTHSHAFCSPPDSRQHLSASTSEGIFYHSQGDLRRFHLQRKVAIPEGDTIYRTAHALQKAIGGKVVTAFETQLAMLASVHDDKSLIGRTVEKVEARGKWECGKKSGVTRLEA
jgi:hypothetical protein